MFGSVLSKWNKKDESKYESKLLLIIIIIVEKVSSVKI